MLNPYLSEALRISIGKMSLALLVLKTLRPKDHAHLQIRELAYPYHHIGPYRTLTCCLVGGVDDCEHEEQSPSAAPHPSMNPRKNLGAPDPWLQLDVSRSWMNEASSGLIRFP